MYLHSKVTKIYSWIKKYFISINTTYDFQKLGEKLILKKKTERSKMAAE